MDKPKRNKAWRRFTQDNKVKKRLKREISGYKYWGYEGDFEYETHFTPQWYDLLGSFYEYRSRTSWTAKKWDDFYDIGNLCDKKYYRPKSKELNRRVTINELKEFHTELD